MATTGQWGGLQVRFNIPEIQDAVAVVNGIFDLIITALDIALTVLNIIKSFVSSLLNPIRALVQELIQTLQNLVLDFRKAGIYVNGDWYLLEDTTFDQLRGGYQGYQRRMLSRLLDRTDLERPTFTDSTTVLALFLYVGVDVSFTNRLANFDQFNLINQLLSGFAQFFGFNINGSSLPTPVGLLANFAGGSTRLPTGGAPPSAVATFRAATSRLLGRTSTILQWSLAPSAGSSPGISSPVVPPDGFLIEISVFPEGLYAGYLAPIEGSTGGVGGVPDEGSSSTPSSYQTGLYEEGGTGRVLQIFGGADSIALDSGVDWNASFDADGNLNDGARPAFFITNLSSTQSIKSNVFGPGDGSDPSRFYNQRTIYIPHEEVLAQSLVGGVFSFELSQTDLPWQTPILEDGTPDFAHAVQPQTVFVRVMSCSNKVTSKNSFQWNILPVQTPVSVMVAPKGEVSASDRGLPSSVVQVSFPSANTNNYIQAVSTALAVMILSRSDLDLPSKTLDSTLTDTLAQPVTGPNGTSITRSDTFAPTGLESFAQNILPLFGNPQDYFTSSANPVAFGSDLLTKIGVLTDQIIERQGNLPDSVMAARAARFATLTEWMWSDTRTEGAANLPALDVTILQSLTPADEDGNQLTTYVAKNAYSLDGTETAPSASLAAARDLGVLATYNTSGFGYAVPGIPKVAKAAPIVVPRGGTSAWYARSLFTEDIYNISADVLGLVAADMTSVGGWIAIRPFQSVGLLSGPQNVASMIQSFLQSIAAGLQGGEDLILNFISMLQQRVREIQEIIRRIRSYLSIPLSIEIPDAVGLALVANGVNGVVSGLTSSTNKPTDGPGAHAGGLVILAGGLPTLITDLLLLLVS